LLVVSFEQLLERHQAYVKAMLGRFSVARLDFFATIPAIDVVQIVEVLDEEEGTESTMFVFFLVKITQGVL
jgi:uncharacterized protein with GYD domain